MRIYFNYLGRSLLPKVSLWVTTALYWFFVLLMLIIIPSILKLAPLSLWTVDVVNVQVILVTLLSIICALLAIYTFRVSIEDQSELLILSKPIKRSTIIFAKFLWAFIITFFIGFVSSIISLFTLCFGEYDPILNSGGMEYSKEIPLFFSLILATTVISLVFLSIGTLVSVIGNRIHIMITCVLVAITISTYTVVFSYIIKPMDERIKNFTGKEPSSVPLKYKDGTIKSFAYMDVVPTQDLYSLYKANQSPMSSLPQYFDVSTQLSGLYKSFNLDNERLNNNTQTFGGINTYKTTIQSQNSNLLATYSNDIKNKVDSLSLPFYPNIFNDSNVIPNPSGYGFLTIAPSLYYIWMSKYIGMSENTVLVSNERKLLDIVPVSFLTINQLEEVKGLEEFDKDVFESITTKVLCDPKLSMIINTGDKELQKECQTDFRNYCKDFIEQNKEKYGFNISSSPLYNLAFTKIQYSMIKQLTSIYWKQIIQRAVESSGLDPSAFLLNKEAFKNSFLENIEVKDPYTEQTIISTTVNYPLYRYLHVAFAYTSLSMYSLGSSIGTYARKGTNFALSGNPIEGEVGDRYYIFPVNAINFSDAITPENIYEYTSKKYVSTKAVTVVWVAIAALLSTITINRYYKIDIK